MNNLINTLLVVQNIKMEYKTHVITAGQTFILGYTNEKNGIFHSKRKSCNYFFDDFTTSNHWVVDFNF